MANTNARLDAVDRRIGGDLDGATCRECGWPVAESRGPAAPLDAETLASAVNELLEDDNGAHVCRGCGKPLAPGTPGAVRLGAWLRELLTE